MKNLVLMATVFAVTLISCKKENDQIVTVIRDCTGTYLRWEGNDYQVCNPEKISAFQDGSTATAVFKKIKDCNSKASAPAVCYMLHLNEGWIEIIKITK